MIGGLRCAYSGMFTQRTWVHRVQMPQILSQVDGELALVEQFIADADAQQFFAVLQNELPWHDEHIRMFGKDVRVPRRVCWCGDPGAVYSYSGVRHDPAPWTATLLDLKQRVELATQQRFNSVLGNLYRNENDSMGWHADKEKELGAQPLIASLSFGAARVFRAQHTKGRQVVNVTLNNGSLLTMSGVFQKHWRHCVPKQTHATLPRINLTFRYIHSP